MLSEEAGTRKRESGGAVSKGREKRNGKQKSSDEVSGKSRDGVEGLKKESGESGRDAGRVHSRAGTKGTESGRRNAQSEMRVWDERHGGW